MGIVGCSMEAAQVTKGTATSQRECTTLGTEVFNYFHNSTRVDSSPYTQQDGPGWTLAHKKACQASSENQEVFKKALFIDSCDEIRVEVLEGFGRTTTDPADLDAGRHGVGGPAMPSQILMVFNASHGEVAPTGCLTNYNDRKGELGRLPFTYAGQFMTTAKALDQITEDNIWMISNPFDEHPELVGAVGYNPSEQIIEPYALQLSETPTLSTYIEHQLSLEYEHPIQLSRERATLRPLPKEWAMFVDESWDNIRHLGVTPKTCGRVTEHSIENVRVADTEITGYYFMRNPCTLMKERYSFRWEIIKPFPQVNADEDAEENPSYLIDLERTVGSNTYTGQSTLEVQLREGGMYLRVHQSEALRDRGNGFAISVHEYEGNYYGRLVLSCNDKVTGSTVVEFTPKNKNPMEDIANFSFKITDAPGACNRSETWNMTGKVIQKQ